MVFLLPMLLKMDMEFEVGIVALSFLISVIADALEA